MFNIDIKAIEVDDVAADMIAIALISFIKIIEPTKPPNNKIIVRKANRAILTAALSRIIRISLGLSCYILSKLVDIIFHSLHLYKV